MRFVGVAVFLLTPGVAAGQVPALDLSEGSDEIIVTAPRLNGEVLGTIPADIELDAAAVESYGASNITDLLTALAPQTGSGRGRGGVPVVLVNGRRVGGFAEIRDLPSEAIERVQVLPEEVALSYGFSADQRVVNFILKPGYKSFSAEVEQATLTQGGRGESEVDLTFVQIDKAGRVALGAQYARATPLLESERGIVQSGTASDGDVRTLIPVTQNVRLAATINRALSKATALTVNGRFEQGDSASLLGRAANGGAIARDVESQTLHGGAALDSTLGKWQVTATANIDQDRSTTLTDTGAISGARDVTRSQTNSADVIVTLSGAVAQLPAGAMRATVRAGFDSRRLKSSSLRSGTLRNTRLRRDDANARVTLDIPLASRDRDVAGFLGKLSANANAGYRRLSDFGSITSFGYGVNWEPFEGLALLASSINEQAAPGINQLGNPSLSTPGVSIYDFAAGQSVLITQISGGNPALVREERRDAKLGATYQVPWVKGMSIAATYFRNRSFNPTASFPTLTPEIERAFAGRVTRDVDGQLISFDQRPINFAQTSVDQLRWSINFSKEFGIPPGARRDGRGEGRGEGRGGFGRGGGPGGMQGGRWNVSLFHNIKFRDDILIRSGVPVLDLLRGSATGASGGSPRHVVEGEGGWFNKGLGLRFSAKFESATRVRGDVAADDLRFSSLVTLGARLFVNFDTRKDALAAIPFLKGSRLALRIDNITGAVRDVRDAGGVEPLSYQSGYIDPRGRIVEVSFRKRF
jgi:outer membrane cobalamin receptor